MAKEEKNECCSGKNDKNKIVDGFLFGIGLSLAFMAATVAVTIFSVALYYIVKAI